MGSGGFRYQPYGSDSPTQGQICVVTGQPHSQTTKQSHHPVTKMGHSEDLKQMLVEIRTNNYLLPDNTDVASVIASNNDDRLYR